MTDERLRSVFPEVPCPSPVGERPFDPEKQQGRTLITEVEVLPSQLEKNLKPPRVTLQSTEEHRVAFHILCRHHKTKQGEGVLGWQGGDIQEKRGFHALTEVAYDPPFETSSPQQQHHHTNDKDILFNAVLLMTC